GQDEQRDPHREHVRAVRERLGVQAVLPPTGAVVGGRVSAPFPRIHTLAPRGIEEAARAFGLRAFEFLMRERVVAAVLDTDVLEQALAASHLIVVASEMADTVREQLHTVRLDMAATIDRRRRDQRHLAADAELHFTEGPLDGLKLIGFSIWERRGGNGRNVTFPARQYTVNGERRAFALLRPIVDVAAQTRVRDLILDAYQQYEERAAAL